MLKSNSSEEHFCSFILCDTTLVHKIKVPWLCCYIIPFEFSGQCQVFTSVEKEFHPTTGWVTLYAKGASKYSDGKVSSSFGKRKTKLRILERGFVYAANWFLCLKIKRNGPSDRWTIFLEMGQIRFIEKRELYADSRMLPCLNNQILWKILKQTEHFRQNSGCLKISSFSK